MTLQEADLDQFEDFDSEELNIDDYSDEGDDYLSGMWGSYSFREGSSPTQDMLVAHGMVQSFVNTFARDGHYQVAFHEGVGSAASDPSSRRIMLTPSPIMDPNITAKEAGLILTGMATHEISHSRYGVETRKAVKRAFPGSRIAIMLSNLLDDVRIEGRFVAEYPGYAGVFEPTLKYLAGQKNVTPSDEYMWGLAVNAVRYDAWSVWTPEAEPHRAWWKSWRARWSREDSPRRHVVGIREGLEYIAANLKKREEKAAAIPPPSPKAEEPETEEHEQTDSFPAEPSPTSDADAGSGPSSEEDDETEENEILAGDPDAYAPEESAKPSEPDEEEQWRQPDVNDEEAAATLNGDYDEEEESGAGGESDTIAEAADEDEAEDEEPDMSGFTDDEIGRMADKLRERQDERDSCLDAGALDDAAEEGGVLKSEVEAAKKEADKIIREAAELEDGVDVARNARGLLLSGRRGYSKDVRRDDSAVRHIRDALMRARSGHTEVSRFKKRGRLDQRGLHRIAGGDYRVFDRKTAPSPDHVIAWLMIDCSSSMGRSSADAASIATAIATASRHVPTFRMEVWGWSNGFHAGRKNFPGVARVWKTGDPVRAIARVADLEQWGTPDSQVLEWAYKAIRREARTGEKPVILFCSDGFGMPDLPEVIKRARKAGVDVRSVAIGSGIRESEQVLRFGPDSVVAWQGSMSKTAKPLARLVADMVTRK